MLMALPLLPWVVVVVFASCCNAFICPHTTGCIVGRQNRCVTLEHSPDSHPQADNVRHLPLATATQELRSMLLLNQTTEDDIIRVEGTVTSKRALGKSFGFFDMAEPDTLDRPLQAMYKRQAYANATFFPVAERLIQPGVRLMVIGRASATRNPGEAVLLVHHIALRGIPSNPQHVRILLQTICRSNDGVGLDIFEFATAANVDLTVLESRLLLSGPDEDQHYDLAREIVANQTEKNHHHVPGKYAQTSPGSFVLPAADPELLSPPPEANTGVPNDEEATPLYFDGDYSTSQNVVVQGTIQNRRRFEGNITAIEVQSPSGTTERVRCVLHPNVFEATSVYYPLMAPGSTVRIEGFLQVPVAQGVPLLWIAAVELVRSSWRPSTVGHVVELLCEGGDGISCSQAARALDITVSECEELRRSTGKTERLWKVSEISARLQTAESRMGGSVSPQLIDSTLSKYRPLLIRYPTKPVQLSMQTTRSQGEPGSRWARKKEPQIQWMVERVQELVKDHPAYGRRKLKIVDIGGGQGFLANHMARKLSSKDTNITVIDVAGRAVKNGWSRSRKQQLSVSYEVGDASTVAVKADIVVALHACGALTDVSLGHAVANNASFVICPCCFRSNSHLRVPFLSEGSAHESSFRSPESFLSVEKQDYSDLRLLAEVQGDTSLSSSAIHSICALRASAVEHWSDVKYNVSINTFPVALSTRNYCLIGRPSS